MCKKNIGNATSNKSLSWDSLPSNFHSIKSFIKLSLLLISIFLPFNFLIRIFNNFFSSVFLFFGLTVKIIFFCKFSFRLLQSCFNVYATVNKCQCIENLQNYYLKNPSKVVATTAANRWIVDRLHYLSQMSSEHLRTEQVDMHFPFCLMWNIKL